MTQSRPQVTVVGSINMDLVVRCAELPNRSQTVLAETSVEICGGKGANQAVAAARAGGQVTMVGRVGDDGFSQRLLSNLRHDNIDVQHVQQSRNCASGLAVVAVERSGQNLILVVPNANGLVSASDIEIARSSIERSDVVLLQLEIPLPTVLTTLEMARGAGVRVILDPAPAPEAWDRALFPVDLVCPNEIEAESIVGHTVDSVESARRAAETIHQMGASAVAITLGPRGTLLWVGGRADLIEPCLVDAVDTTAAGDAFAGALAVAWAETDDLIKAVQFGNAAGAWSATAEGAQPSMGSREQIETLRRPA